MAEEQQSFIVSARKYRPQTFDSVIGQKTLTDTLKNTIASNRLASAYLFCGPRGVGKTTCARIFAKTINCENRTADNECCGECSSCKSFAEGRSMNIYELDAASNNKVEDMHILIEKVMTPPMNGGKSVYIIDEVHMLTTQAFNAFLKTLEEPPKHAVFIMATTEKHKVLPTILSRCQTYDFKRITIDDTIDHLSNVAEKESVKYEREALAIIAQKADGGMRDALSIFDQTVASCNANLTYEAVTDALGILGADYYFNVVNYCLKGEVKPIIMLINDVVQRGFDLGNFITSFSSHLRNLLMARDPQTMEILSISNVEKEKYKEQAQRCTDDFIYIATRLVVECDRYYPTSKNKRLLVELTLIRMSRIVGEKKNLTQTGV